MYYKIIKTRWFIPSGLQALTLGPFILVRPKSAENEPLIEHEKIHVQQFWFDPFGFWLKYLLCRKCRLRYEVAGYRAQYELQPMGLDTFARLLATRYRLKITQDEARRLILGEEDA